MRVLFLQGFVSPDMDYEASDAIGYGITSAEATHSFSLELSGRSYVRAELRGYRGRPERGEVVWAMTNPIWLGIRE